MGGWWEEGKASQNLYIVRINKLSALQSPLMSVLSASQRENGRGESFASARLS